MLYTKFHGKRSTGSREDFRRILPYMGVAAILVMCPRRREQTLSSLYPWKLHRKKLAFSCQAVLEMFENCGRTDDDDGRRSMGKL